MSTPDDRSRWDAPPSGQDWSATPPSGWGAPPSGPVPSGYGPPPEHSGPRSTEPKAVVALVLALGAYVVLPFLPAVAALFVARSARRDIDRSGGRLTGRGLATAATVLSWVNIVLCVAGVVLVALGLALFAGGFS